jgi:hypothetical protein
MTANCAILGFENNISSLFLAYALPIFLDVHKVPFTEDNLKELCKSPRDEFGVTHVNLLYNSESGVCFCLLHAPDIEAVEKHHRKVNIQCEWITEVTNIVNEAFKLNQTG